VESGREDGAESVSFDELRGDRQTQHDVLEALAECANHRVWFAAFARPYLGEHPIEIGSGFGDYAKQWIPVVDKFTATEADPALLPGLQAEMAAYSNVEVKLLLLPTQDRADYSSLIAYNVLEHIEDHVGALESMARLVRPEGHLILVCPAFPFAMSPVDIATGHVRRYTKRSMSEALTDAGLEIVSIRYANSLGLICYYAFTSVMKRQPKIGGTISFYDRLLVPIIRVLERIVGRPPFGQSVVAIARVPEEADQAEGK